jgi:hypothetical protein
MYIHNILLQHLSVMVMQWYLVLWIVIRHCYHDMVCIAHLYIKLSAPGTEREVCLLRELRLTK